MSKIVEGKNQSGPAKLVGGLHTFYGAYCAYREECAKIDRQWGDGTQIQYESIIEKRLVSNLPNHDETPIRRYTLENFRDTIAIIRQRGQNNDPSNYVPYDEDTLAKYLHIMKTVVKVSAEKEFFQNVFEDSGKGEAKSKGQIQRMRELWVTPKSLSAREERQVAKYLLQHLDKRGEFIALFLMYCLGLRNEEACAVNFGHIYEMQEYPGYFYITVPQSTHLHRNETRLEVKTYNAYRNVPIPSLAVKVIFALKEKRIQILQKTPNFDVPIEKMWIAYFGKNQLVRCGADSVTRQAKKMFEELGMRETVSNVAEYLLQDFEVAKEEQIDVDEFTLIEKDPTAYLLRRNFATHMAILQLTETQLSYIIGHVIEAPQTRRSDFLEERELFAITVKMDKRPIVNDITMIPSKVIEPNSNIKFFDYSQEYVVGSRTRRVKVHTIANEPGDKIVVTVEQRNGATIKESVDLYGTPYPQHFHRVTDVLKAYHAAFQKDNAPK